MKKQSALITPSVIKWAREKSHYSLSEASKKIGVTSEKLEQWESGKSYPTITQARKMSQVYKRPLASFYLPHPPKDFPLLKDFRTAGGESPKYSPPLVFLMRQLQERQVWLKEYLKDQGYEKLHFVGSWRGVRSSVQNLSKNIIQTMWGGKEEYLKIKSKSKTKQFLLNNWLSQCEKKGIFISRTSNLDSHNVISVTEARGFAISDKYAPFIFINSGDSPNAQLFTLLHELVHLWLGVSRVPIHFGTSYEDTQNSEEFFCNQAAAEILMPGEEIKAFPKLKNIEKIENFIEEHHKKFYVSRLALLIRMKTFALLSGSNFNTLKKEYIKKSEEYQKNRKQKLKKGKGGPNANLLKINANGKGFIKIVAYSYKEGAISGREASYLLDMKLNRMEKILTMLA